MSSRQHAVTNLLNSMSSTRTSDALENLRNEPGQSVKALGSQVNSMILQSIQEECKRNADLTVQLCESLVDIKEIMHQQHQQVTELTSVMKDLAAVLASSSVKSLSHNSSGISDLSGKSKEYYYKGVKLSNRYHIYACVIAHLINMIFTHMEKKVIRYPDSVNCDFNDLVNAVRIVCGSKCLISSVSYSMPINANSKSKPVMGSLYRYIASTSQSGSATLLESNIGKIYNESTREDIFVNIERVMERLTFLHGVLSPKQIDAMKSIKYPIAIGGEEEELHLNYDETFWKGRQSHPVTNSVIQLPHAKTGVYIEQIMVGKAPAVAYAIALETESASRNKT